MITSTFEWRHALPLMAFLAIATITLAVVEHSTTPAKAANGTHDEALVAPDKAGGALRPIILEVNQQSAAPSSCLSARKLPKAVRVVEQRDRKSIASDVVDGLGALATHRDDCVRTHAAISLGLIGAPSALRAVPELQRALRELYARKASIIASFDSEGAVRMALAKISGDSLWKSCDVKSNCPWQEFEP